MADQNFQTNEKTLGRGLSSLIPNKNAPGSGNLFFKKVEPASYLPKIRAGAKNQILEVPPALIKINPYQPRQRFEAGALESLKKSIAEHGILQPLVVNETMAGQYELVAGERRLRAASELGLKTVPVILRRTKDMEKLELSLIENIQREDLNPMEKARAYKKLLENFQLTQEEAARRLAVPRSTLNNTLRLLNLPAEAQQALSEGKISEGQAKLILSVADEREQAKILAKTQHDALTVRDTEREVKRVSVKNHLRLMRKKPEYEHWENALSRLFGTRVAIRQRGRQGGFLEIEFYAEEELAAIIEKILGG